MMKMKISSVLLAALLARDSLAFAPRALRSSTKNAAAATSPLFSSTSVAPPSVTSAGKDEIPSKQEAPQSSSSDDNFDWFKQRTSDFWYVDRIVVSKHCSGSGYGRLLYESIFNKAIAAGAKSITCEYSTQPQNIGSAAFHQRMGFEEIGTRVDTVKNKHLSMQLRSLP